MTEGAAYLETRLWQACQKARDMQKKGTPAGLANAKAGEWYGYTASEVAEGRAQLRLIYAARRKGEEPKKIKKYDYSRIEPCPVCGKENEHGPKREWEMEHAADGAVLIGLRCHQCKQGPDTFRPDPTRLEGDDLFMRHCIKDWNTWAKSRKTKKHFDDLKKQGWEWSKNMPLLSGEDY